MKTFKDLKLKHTYNSEKDDLLKSFYIPVLKTAIKYDRIAGYFSSDSFRISAEGLSHLIEKKGKIRLIMNVQLMADDFNCIEKSYKSPEDIISKLILDDIDSITETLKKDRLSVMAWMLINKLLEIKIGYIKEKLSLHDILHQKVGILEDKAGNKISFSGSNNESSSGWLFNSEKFKVFFDWQEGSKDYISDDITDFDELWTNNSRKSEVISFPKAVEKKLITFAPKTDSTIRKLLDKMMQGEKEDKPKLKEIKLRDYQIEAVNAWFDNGGRGMFEMGTGTGKTFTAIGILKKLLEREKKLITIISCPFLHLVPQWEDSVKAYGIKVRSVFASSLDSKWQEKIISNLLDMQLNRVDKLLIYTSHDTISSPKFRKAIEDNASNISICMIGDEVHGMGSSNRISGLLERYNYRLGLSATPKRYFDDDGTQGLYDFFGDPVYTFDLDRAINEINPDTGQTYLTPYEYHPIFVDLDEEELENYIALSKVIARLSSIKEKTRQQKEILKAKLRYRQDIVRNAAKKLDSFALLLKELKEAGDLSHTLVYCSPQQIVNIQDIIMQEKKIIQHKFTSGEDATRKNPKFDNLTEREYILNNFDKGIYQILVAIKCLDEGVDVPATKNAILISSTGNPKEYIQRRGRVLRRSKGKDKAIIYDLVVEPSSNEENIKYCSKVVQSEFKRVEEFARLALNKDELEQKLYNIKKKYNILEDGN